MAKLIEMSLEDIPNFSAGTRGRMSYPIVKAFMESNAQASMVDPDYIKELGTSRNSLQQSLKSYCRNHELPIHVITRGGNIFLIRITEPDEDGGLDTLTADNA